MLYEHPNGGIANGSGAYLFTGTTANNLIRRTVIRFDIAGSIPAGSTITEATLTLTVSRTRTGTPRVTTLHRIGASWTEGESDAPGAEGPGTNARTGDATWVHRTYTSQPWITPGGDYLNDPSAMAAVGGLGPVSWESTGRTVEDVQLWLDGPSVNHGWILISVESVNQTAKRYGSRENPDESARPVLAVRYIPPPA